MKNFTKIIFTVFIVLIFFSLCACNNITANEKKQIEVSEPPLMISFSSQEQYDEFQDSVNLPDSDFKSFIEEKNFVRH